ncbi:hypothetical protein J4468_02870 [Candidatus Woesearchaeota archaeon]|nr:hypothetical protein [Candidatus Woesearchaeota archaeon]
MKKQKLGIWLAYIMQSVILVYIVLAFIKRDYLDVFGGIIALFITFLPLILKRKWRITLPWWLNLLVVFSLFLHMGGQVREWYILFYPFYDKFGHFVGSATIALLGFASALIGEKFSNINLNKGQMIFFIIIFTMAIGSFWEIGEFILDQTIGTNAQHGLIDTMQDLIFNFFGSLIIAFIIFLKIDERKKMELIKKLWVLK